MSVSDKIIIVKPLPHLKAKRFTETKGLKYEIIDNSPFQLKALKSLINVTQRIIGGVLSAKKYIGNLLKKSGSNALFVTNDGMRRGYLGFGMFKCDICLP